MWTFRKNTTENVCMLTTSVCVIYLHTGSYSRIESIRVCVHTKVCVLCSRIENKAAVCVYLVRIFICVHLAHIFVCIWCIYLYVFGACVYLVYIFICIWCIYFVYAHLHQGLSIPAGEVFGWPQTAFLPPKNSCVCTWSHKHVCVCAHVIYV